MIVYSNNLSELFDNVTAVGFFLTRSVYLFLAPVASSQFFCMPQRMRLSILYRT